MLAQNFFEQFIKRFNYFNVFKKIQRIINNNLNFLISKKFSKFIIKEMLSLIIK